MAQYKKDSIKDSIDAAALAVFARKGYKAAKISDIAAAAGVSVGNLYRYYQSKDEIFNTILPEEFPNQMLAALRDKVGAAKDALKIDSGAFRQTAEAFTGLMLAERERIIILFSGSGDSKYERFRSSFASAMLSIVKSSYEKEYAAYLSEFGGDDMLYLIYENLIRLYADILMRQSAEEETANSIRQINLYHFTGITRLFDLQEDR